MGGVSLAIHSDQSLTLNSALYTFVMVFYLKMPSSEILKFG